MHIEGDQMTFRFKVKGDPKVDAAYPWLAWLEHCVISSCISLVAAGLVLDFFFDGLVIELLGGMFLGLGVGMLLVVGILRTILTEQVIHD